MLSDLELVYLWRQFSDECYDVGWTDVCLITQKQFKDWLNGRIVGGRERKLEIFEWEGLPAIREAYQSRLGEIAGKSLPPPRIRREPQVLKDSLKAKAVSVAAAIRDGTATAQLVRSFLQEDIPPLDAEYPLPDERKAGSREELAVEFKCASAFTLIKGIGALMSEDIDSAIIAVYEYLDVRRCAKKAGLASCIINPPGGDDPLDPAFRDPPVELYRMIYIEGIEDPIKQRREMLRFQKEDYHAGLGIEKGDPDWHYR